MAKQTPRRLAMVLTRMAPSQCFHSVIAPRTGLQPSTSCSSSLCEMPFLLGTCPSRAGTHGEVHTCIHTHTNLICCVPRISVQHSTNPGSFDNVKHIHTALLNFRMILGFVEFSSQGTYLGTQQHFGTFAHSPASILASIQSAHSPDQVFLMCLCVDDTGRGYPQRAWWAALLLFVQLWLSGPTTHGV